MAENADTDPGDGRVTVVAELQVQAEVVRVIETLVPLLEGLAVHRADVGEPPPAEVRDEVPADEPARPRDDDKPVVCFHVGDPCAEIAFFIGWITFDD